MNYSLIDQDSYKKLNKKVKYKAVLLSPHLDDAILSCFNCLTQNPKTTLLISFFTQAQDNSLSSDAFNFIKKSGYNSAIELFEKRKKNDQKICKKLKLNYLYFNFTDAGFRTEKENFLYHNNASIFSGKQKRADLPINKQLKQSFSFLKNKITSKNAKIYAPLGVGQHIDHMLIHQLARKTFKQNLFFWEDIPYRNNQRQLIKRLKDLKIKSVVDQFPKPREKQQILKLYKTQITELKKAGLSTYDLYYERIYSLQN